MKKLILLFVVCCLFLSSSCSCNNKYVTLFYDEESEWTECLDMFYNAINTEGSKYAAFDLRTKELYENEHLRQFQNYDLSMGSVDKFYSYLTKNYSSKYTIYIYIESLDDLTYFDKLSETYKEINIYIGDYESLRNLGDELFTFDSGPYDCNC